VPSGALADTIGRRPLLIAAAVLMVLEMLCLLVAPLNGGAFLLELCVLNRILSGLSEAAASGADEALAYDSLPEARRESAWDRVLVRAMRWRSAGFVIAMILGGMLYDPSALNRLLPGDLAISREFAHRLPVLLVLCQAFACVVITLRMVEPPREVHGHPARVLRNATRLTLQSARWIVSHSRVMVIVVFGLCIDSVVRNFATINSSYYRLIELPEWTYGIIGALIGVLGWFVPGIARRLNGKFGTLRCLWIAAATAIAGLAALVPAIPLLGILSAMLLMSLLGFLGFTISRALNRETPSHRRATVLSVKGLAFNLGYGLFSLAFSMLLASLPDDPAGAALAGALLRQVPAFAAVALVLTIWSKRLWK
jgi:MFS family permease